MRTLKKYTVSGAFCLAMGLLLMAGGSGKMGASLACMAGALSALGCVAVLCRRWRADLTDWDDAD